MVRREGNGILQPIQVAFTSAAHGQKNKLRGVVRVFREDQLFERGQPGRGGLQNHKHFSAGLQLPLPPIVRFNSWNQVGARDQPRLQRGLGQFTRSL